MDMSDFLDVLLDEDGDSEGEHRLRQSIERTRESSGDSLDSDSDYRLTSFRNIIDFAVGASEFAHLLDTRDWEIIESVTSLPLVAQRLFVRLYLRKHHWIRSSSMNYPDVAGPDAMPQLLQLLVQRKLLIPCMSFIDC